MSPSELASFPLMVTALMSLTVTLLNVTLPPLNANADVSTTILELFTISAPVVAESARWLFLIII